MISYDLQKILCLLLGPTARGLGTEPHGAARNRTELHGIENGSARNRTELHGIEIGSARNRTESHGVARNRFELLRWVAVMSVGFEQFLKKVTIWSDLKKKRKVS